MDMEFKSEEDKKEFCAKVYWILRKAYKAGEGVNFDDPVDIFRLVRVLEDIHYPK